MASDSKHLDRIKWLLKLFFYGTPLILITAAIGLSEPNNTELLWVGLIWGWLAFSYRTGIGMK